ncbi:MAG TPA: succinate dehydrogenase, partial [Flavobacteriaceae bacterium]|nr:succinate dehydrogenase [Flavobacteriaceae bacterium]
MSGFLSSSIARKFAMALSALFLIFFLIIHLAVNLTSLFSEALFNELSHFMGTNPLIQFALQPVLIFGVVFHFVLGFVLEIKNRKSRGVQYVKYNGAA